MWCCSSPPSRGPRPHSVAARAEAPIGMAGTGAEGGGPRQASPSGQASASPGRGPLRLPLPAPPTRPGRAPPQARFIPSPYVLSWLKLAKSRWPLPASPLWLAKFMAGRPSPPPSGGGREGVGNASSRRNASAPAAAAPAVHPRPPHPRRPLVYAAGGGAAPRLRRPRPVGPRRPPPCRPPYRRRACAPPAGAGGAAQAPRRWRRTWLGGRAGQRCSEAKQGPRGSAAGWEIRTQASVPNSDVSPLSPALIATATLLSRSLQTPQGQSLSGPRPPPPLQFCFVPREVPRAQQMGQRGDTGLRSWPQPVPGRSPLSAMALSWPGVHRPLGVPRLAGQPGVGRRRFRSEGHHEPPDPGRGVWGH